MTDCQRNNPYSGQPSKKRLVGLQCILLLRSRRGKHFPLINVLCFCQRNLGQVCYTWVLTQQNHQASGQVMQDCTEANPCSLSMNSREEIFFEHNEFGQVSQNLFLYSSILKVLHTKLIYRKLQQIKSQQNSKIKSY